MVKEPTRDNNTLDLFLTNHPNLVQSTKTLPPLGQGGHDIVHHELKINLGRNKQKPVKLYKKTDWDGFRTDMAEYQTAFFKLSENMNTNSKWNLFKSTLNKLSDKFIPTKLCRPKDGHPWINNSIKRLMRKRDKLYARYKSDRTNYNIKSKFTSLKHKIQSEIRQAYNQYIHSIINDQPENAEQPARPNKRFWTLIKQQKSDSKEITSLKSIGVTYTKASDKANILNVQFQSVFTKPVPLKLKHLAELILPGKLISPTMPNMNITVNGVSKQLSKLNPGKAAGPDNLTSRILKELHSEVAPMLSDIFNSSLREGKVPDDWRNASVSPVYKKGAKTKAENYRPISLTCICCKVMEHVITSNIMAYLDKHQLLHSNQHGFRKKLSCETQLVQFVQDISDTLNESGQTDIIVMDFSKAFDKVDHQRLLLKLHRFGINNDVITWIGSFLPNRTQRVVLEGEESDICPVMSGVPQGSVLGPCLFLLYINDMPDMIESNIRLFADDTIMYLTVSNQADCQVLQSDLSKLETWESERLMAFNHDKCEVIRITNKKKPTLFNYTLHGVGLKETDSAKYLGVNISRDLSWAKHINQITMKTNNSLKFIKRNIQTNNPKLKESAYKTYVRPLVEYAASVWDPWQKIYINKIEMIQHRAIRYIFNDYSFTSSVSNMLSKLNLPTLEKRRQISSLTMFYKIKHHLVNIPFPGNIQPSMRSRYTFARSRINIHRYSFFPLTAKLWNNLPPDLCNSPDLGSFRAGLFKTL